MERLPETEGSGSRDFVYEECLLNNVEISPEEEILPCLLLSLPSLEGCIAWGEEHKPVGKSGSAVHLLCGLGQATDLSEPHLSPGASLCEVPEE